MACARVQNPVRDVGVAGSNPVIPTIDIGVATSLGTAGLKAVPFFPKESPHDSALSLWGFRSEAGIANE